MRKINDKGLNERAQEVAMIINWVGNILKDYCELTKSNESKFLISYFSYNLL